MLTKFSMYMFEKFYFYTFKIQLSPSSDFTLIIKVSVSPSPPMKLDLATLGEDIYADNCSLNMI